MLDKVRLSVEVRRLSKTNQALPILLLLHHLQQPAKPSAIVGLAIEVGFKSIKNWNISDILKKLANASMVAKIEEGWIALAESNAQLEASNCYLAPKLLIETRHGLKDHVARVKSADRRRFLDETLICLDARAYRAAIVLAWVGAVHVLQEHIVSNHLAAFNAAGIARHPKDFKILKNSGDFGRMKEGDLLQLCEDASIFGKAEKQELGERLGLRNRCGHPNSIVFAEHAAAAHVETLISTVYEKY